MMVADFGFRHHRANHVPAFPALAGVEAQYLTATAGQDGVDLGRRLRRTGDLDEVDRFQQYRRALRQCPVTPMRARPAMRNAMSDEIDRVIGTVDQRHRNVHDRKAERPLLEGVDHAFFDGGDVVAGNHAARDLLFERESGIARPRLDIENDIAELTVAAGLLLVTAALLDRTLDGFAIADGRSDRRSMAMPKRSASRSVATRKCISPWPQTTDFVRLGIVHHRERGVFFEQLGQGEAELHVRGFEIGNHFSGGGTQVRILTEMRRCGGRPSRRRAAARRSRRERVTRFALLMRQMNAAEFARERRKSS